jgi:hypothetical protein
MGVSPQVGALEHSIMRAIAADRRLMRESARHQPPATGLRVDGGMLRWSWPGGCTEMVVVWRADALVLAADDPEGHARKVTNTRYQIDGGVPHPPDRPLHVAVFACLRIDGRLLVASTAAPSARVLLPER